MEHADGYEAFLRANLDALTEDFDDGDGISGHPELRRLTIKRRPSGDGHIAIYRVDSTEETVFVLHVLHTKMDVAARIAGDYPPK